MIPEVCGRVEGLVASRAMARSGCLKVRIMLAAVVLDTDWSLYQRRMSKDASEGLPPTTTLT